MWFEKLMGFEEKNPEQVRSNIVIDGDYLISKINAKKYKWGQLEIPTLKELSNSILLDSISKEQLEITQIVANVQELHAESTNNGALFQAASQFNLLEMVGPDITPEQGIGIYEHDYTQGPACAIACGAGTIYRNYFVDIDGHQGQTSKRQVDCLEEIAKEFDNEKLQHWELLNGYVLPTHQGLHTINKYIAGLDDVGYESLKSKLKVGIQSDTEVTFDQCGHTVAQVYCSALPVAYSSIEDAYWEPFARLILEATYEATFYAALKNYRVTGNPKLFLTLVGGGAFGNQQEWIFEAVEKAVEKFKQTPLKVFIVSYGRLNTSIDTFIQDLMQKNRR